MQLYRRLERDLCVSQPRSNYIEQVCLCLIQLRSRGEAVSLMRTKISFRHNLLMKYHHQNTSVFYFSNLMQTVISLAL